MPLLVPTNAIPLARYKLEINWYKGVGGADTSPLWTDADWTSAGAYVDMTPYIDDQAGISINRGKDGGLSQVQSGSMTVPILDDTGIFSPQNGSSPLAPNVLPGCGARLSVIYAGTQSTLFFGFLQRITRNPTKRGRGTLTFADPITPWAIHKNLGLQGTNLGSTTQSGLIAAMNAIPWAYYSFSTGITVVNSSPPAFSSQLDTMSLVNGLVAPTGGTFWIAADGTARFVSMGGGTGGGSLATIEAALLSYPTEADIGLVINEAIVTMTRPNNSSFRPNPQRVTNSASVAKYGKRNWSLDSPYYVTDSAALTLASQVVNVYHSPVNRARTITFEARDDNTAKAAFRRDLGDTVTIIDDRDGTNHSFTLWGIAHQISSRKHAVTWNLAPGNM